ncbi:export membrane domain protein, partial [Bordetella bronchiseptica 00-P-2730]
MKFPHFFIARPIFAVVLSLLMLLAGSLAFWQLPLSEYPAVTPPTVQVTASYPGANPDVIADTVAAPLEQVVNGVEGMLYMNSQMATDGRMVLTIAFKQGTDPDMAQIQVQNRVARALPRLPEEVQRIGVVTQKTSPDVLMVVHIVSPDKRYDSLYLSNFAIRQVRDELARLPGVGDVLVWGAGEYAMRIWLDPAKVATRGLTASDVVAALREQNVQVAAGSVGQQPDTSAAFQVTVNTLGRLTSAEQFGDIVVKTGADGQVTRLRDVARVSLGADAYTLRSLIDGESAPALQIIQSPGANAIDVSNAVRARMETLQQDFPQDIEYRIAYDPTVFVRASLQSVAITLLEAIFLVVIVVVLFLQTWRASIIPLVAVPVSLVGTFAVMHGFGFSLNTLSLFGLVLSIGIVVDDAIVVVENVERHMALGEPPEQAARKAMDEVTGPI